MTTIWETTDRFGRRVELTEERWSHIVDQRGGQPPTQDDIRRALEDPIRVTIDATFAHRECFYAECAPSRMVKVVVHFRPVPPQGTWRGAVVTAYPERKVKPGEVQRWP